MSCFEYFLIREGQFSRVFSVHSLTSRMRDASPLRCRDSDGLGQDVYDLHPQSAVPQPFAVVI